MDEIGWMRMYVCVWVGSMHSFFSNRKNCDGPVSDATVMWADKKRQGVTRGSKGVCQEVADSKRKNSSRGS